MSRTQTQSKVISRRGELLAELFLQDLDPEFVARPTGDLGYDFFLGFKNAQGGINNVAVEVKATERLAANRYPIPIEQFNLWTNSNIPILLVVADVKKNRIFFALPGADAAILPDSEEPSRMLIPLQEIDEQSKKSLRERLTA